MLYAYGNRFHVTENLEIFWKLNKALNSKNLFRGCLVGEIFSKVQL